MHTCIPSHGLIRSWHSCPRWVNASSNNKPSMRHPQRRNVTISMVGLKKTNKNGHIYKNLIKNGEPQRYSWEDRRRRRKRRRRRRKWSVYYMVVTWVINNMQTVKRCCWNLRQKTKSHRYNFLCELTIEVGILHLHSPAAAGGWSWSRRWHRAIWVLEKLIQA